ncbi:YIF1-domain-containing protein [Panus rudis PR-1116 ss-1]|nr:YIF1-domain-containing protein [Panus rudis PR-1116 ss-1]
MYGNNRSPPPLQHPVPTHPAYIPEPPSTPISPQGYERYTSSPPQAQTYAQPIPTRSSISPSYMNHGGQYQPMGSPPRQAPIPSHGAPQGQIPPQGRIPTAPVDFSAWGLNDATAQFGMQLGQSAVAAGQDYVQKNLGGLIPITAVKYYFHVSNSYVLNKLRLLVFPWRHKPWSRRSRLSENGQRELLPPTEDINAPDLYIPLMAFVTYILLAAVHSGVNSNFNPEILGLSASTALMVVLLDLAFVKLGCYIMGIQGPTQVLDLLSYNGYKFVGVIITLLVGLLHVGRTLYVAVFLYTFFATAFFLLRSLRSVILPDASATASPVNTAARSRRIMFLFLVAATQIVYMGLLVRV